MESSATKTKKAKADVYRIVTERIIDLLDQGTIPWKRTWKGGFDGIPRNLVTNRPYRGINVPFLIAEGFESPYWLSFKQAKQLGGSVRKGEKGTPVVFWKVYQKRVKDEDGEERVENRFLLRYYTVFNLFQTEGVRIPKGRLVAEGEGDEEIRFGDADKIFEDYVSREGIEVSYGHSKAVYRIRQDLILLPSRSQFVDEGSFHVTRFHEAVHSTGAKNRLNRPGIAEFDFFGSHQYSDEELVAEFGASFLASICGVDRDSSVNSTENSAAYINTWKSRLEQDRRIVVYAAQRAQKAVDFILGEVGEEDEVDG